MPYKINQISPRRYQVVNAETGTIHSKSTTRKKAEAQLRLLENLEKKEMKPKRATLKGRGNILRGARNFLQRIREMLNAPPPITDAVRDRQRQYLNQIMSMNEEGSSELRRGVERMDTRRYHREMYYPTETQSTFGVRFPSSLEPLYPLHLPSGDIAIPTEAYFSGMDNPVTNNISLLMTSNIYKVIMDESISSKQLSLILLEIERNIIIARNKLIKNEREAQNLYKKSQGKALATDLTNQIYKDRVNYTNHLEWWRFLFMITQERKKAVEQKELLGIEEPIITRTARQVPFNTAENIPPSPNPNPPIIELQEYTPQQEERDLMSQEDSGRGISMSRPRRRVQPEVPPVAEQIPREHRTFYRRAVVVVPESVNMAIPLPPVPVGEVVEDPFHNYSLEDLRRTLELFQNQLNSYRREYASYDNALPAVRRNTSGRRRQLLYLIQEKTAEIDQLREKIRERESPSQLPRAFSVARGLKKTIEKVVETGKALLKGRSKYSPRIQSILKKYGNVKIRGATIKRSPVPTFLTSVLGTLSPEFAKRFKESPYDKLFHLYLVLQMENGRVLVIEKNETLSMSEKYSKRKEEEEMPVSVPSGLTLSTLLEKTQEKMGTQNFFGYSAKDNNCQDFMIALLKANSMGDNKVFEFVKQDTSYLFDNLPYLRKLSNTLTDIAGRANVVLEGTGLKEKIETLKQRIQSLGKLRQKYWNANNQDALEIINQEIGDLEKQIESMQQERYNKACDKVRGELEESSVDKRPEGVKPIPDARGLGKPKIQKGSPEALEWCKRMREAKIAKGKK